MYLYCFYILRYKNKLKNIFRAERRLDRFHTVSFVCLYLLSHRPTITCFLIFTSWNVGPTLSTVNWSNNFGLKQNCMFLTVQHYNTNIPIIHFCLRLSNLELSFIYKSLKKIMPIVDRRCVTCYRSCLLLYTYTFIPTFIVQLVYTFRCIKHPMLQAHLYYQATIY